MPRIAAFHQVSRFSVEVAAVPAMAEAAAGRATARTASVMMANIARRARRTGSPDWERRIYCAHGLS